MKFLLLLLLIPQLSDAKTIALLDTGVSVQKQYNKQIIKSLNFHNKIMQDEDGHGTHLAGILIDFGNSKANKVISIKIASHDGELMDYLLGLRAAIDLHPDVINISFTHDGTNEIEQLLFESADKKGIKIVVSAGNHSQNLDKDPVYPCSYTYKNVYCVGSIDDKGKTSTFSNYGKVVRYWEHGENVVSFGVKETLQIYSGTSQAAAIFSKNLK